MKYNIHKILSLQPHLQRRLALLIRTHNHKAGNYLSVSKVSEEKLLLIVLLSCESHPTYFQPDANLYDSVKDYSDPQQPATHGYVNVDPNTTEGATSTNDAYVEMVRRELDDHSAPITTPTGTDQGNANQDKATQDQPSEDNNTVLDSEANGGEYMCTNSSYMGWK